MMNETPLPDEDGEAEQECAYLRHEYLYYSRHGYARTALDLYTELHALQDGY